MLKKISVRFSCVNVARNEEVVFISPPQVYANNVLK